MTTQASSTKCAITVWRLGRFKCAITVWRLGRFVTGSFTSFGSGDAAMDLTAYSYNGQTLDRCDILVFITGIIP